MGGDTPTPAIPKKWNRPPLWAGLALVMAVFLVFVVFLSHRGLYQLYVLRQEGLRLEQENARLAEENARLARTIDRLQHDPEMIQDLIRRELNFVKRNEIIFQFPPGVGVPSAASSGLPPGPGGRLQVGKERHHPGSPEGHPPQGVPPQSEPTARSTP